MTGIEQKALALLNAVAGTERYVDLYEEINEHYMKEALCRAIERHESDKAAYGVAIESFLKSQEAAQRELSDFRQEVSDAVWDYYGGKHIPRTSMFAKFAIPKPDPLMEVIEAWFSDFRQEVSDAASFRTALEAYGLEIREKNDD